MELEPTTKRVATQLASYGAVSIDSPRTGTMRDCTGEVWRWEVLMDQVTFSRNDWRTRTISVENVSEHMFRWLYRFEECRSGLEFPMTLEEAIEEFGIDAVYKAYRKFRRIKELSEQD